MFSGSQEYLFKDFFIIFAAIFGLVVIVVIQLRNAGFRFRPIGRRREDLSRLVETTRNTRYDKHLSHQQNKYEINFDDSFHVWKINAFECYMVNTKTRIEKVDNLFWYVFSKSKEDTEKIMSPIIRKIINKYKNRFESEKSIQFIQDEGEQPILYSWLRNETHFHTVIYNFLDECLYISKEIKSKINLIIKIGDCIIIEIDMQKNDAILLFEEDFKQIYAVDFVHENGIVKIRFWLAFAQDRVPTICVEHYAFANIIEEPKKVS